MTLSMFILAALSSLLMHPVHETVCEVEWNAETKRVEVALRLDALDEQWIKKDFGQELQPKWEAGYIRSRILFDAGDSARSGLWSPKAIRSGRPIKWIGRKEDGAHVWWFFEVICENGQPPTTVQTRLLFDRHQNYQHRIVILGETLSKNGKRPTVLLTEQTPKATLRFQP